MILLIHIITALASVLFSSLTFFKPSMNKLAIGYGLIIGTIASGTVLIVTASASVLHACVAGLVYTTAITLVTIATHVRIRRTAQQQ
ncbi:MAG: hypothetical protein ACREGE_04545 [Candidatus Microsaccharimonas sp.]